MTMPWFRVDDSYWSHPKVLLSPPEVRGVWITAGTWCAQHMTDGRIPVTVLHRLIPLSAKRVDALGDELEVAGMWYRDGDEWVFHDWSDYQPSREQVRQDRERAAERQRAWRKKKADRNAVTNGVTNTVSHASPTRPDPTRPDPSNYIDARPPGPSASMSYFEGGAEPCKHGATRARLCALCRMANP